MLWNRKGGGYRHHPLYQKPSLLAKIATVGANNTTISKDTPVVASFFPSAKLLCVMKCQPYKRRWGISLSSVWIFWRAEFRSIQLMISATIRPNVEFANSFMAPSSKFIQQNIWNSILNAPRNFWGYFWLIKPIIRKCWEFFYWNKFTAWFERLSINKLSRKLMTFSGFM